VIRSGLALSGLTAAVFLTGCGGTQLSATPVTSTAPSVQVATAAGSRPPNGSTASVDSATTASHRKLVIQQIVAVELYQPLAQYTLYVNRLLARLRPQLRSLHAATAAGNRTAAESDWVSAHATWLLIGQDDDAYGAFGELGQQIDGPAAGLPGTTSNPAFTGFHKVEFDLWRKHNVNIAAADSAKLVSLVNRLTPKAVTADLPNTALSLDGWVLRCHEILEDALRDSLSQNDDYGSNSDLASLAADVTATREMLGVLMPLLDSRVPTLVPRGARDLTAIDNAIDAAGGPLAVRDLTQLPLRQRQGLDQATGAALETLAPVSELMQVVVPGS
jgi:high-affinity iron transporter